MFGTDDQAAGNAAILALRPGVDSVATPLAATPAEELGPAISPDGHWIAYSSNATGRREIWVRPFPETGRGRYRVSTKGGISPAWNSDGRELFSFDAPRLSASRWGKSATCSSSGSTSRIGGTVSEGPAEGAGAQGCPRPVSGPPSGWVWKW